MIEPLSDGPPSSRHRRAFSRSLDGQSQQSNGVGLRQRGSLRSSGTWLQAFNRWIKRGLRDFALYIADMVRSGPSLLGPPRRAALAELEIAALRMVVTEMRKELQASHYREKRVRHLAFHDDLTALPNRRHFLERLRVELKGGTDRSLQLAVIYLDLDGFKLLNDAHGHDTGDQLLKIVAARLTHAVRAEDLVSRLGGDEYACLISGVSNRERLESIASNLYEAVSHPFQVDGHTFNVRPSIGVAVFPDDGTTTATLMKSADAAMYAAKHRQSRTSFAERRREVSHCSA